MLLTMLLDDKIFIHVSWLKKIRTTIVKFFILKQCVIYTNSSMCAKFQENLPFDSFHGQKQIHLLVLQGYIWNCHIPHFEADKKSATVAIYFKLWNLISKIIFYLKKYIILSMVFHEGHLMIQKCTKCWYIFWVIQL